ncbi:hypothetical protein LOD99_13370 [Oopsacas minuta]|uniref:Uncharacterized protein n=1 Tax=Oopsacas minuta TaxID=111878 RepID=A0AAV7KJ86_9METZ|nr:hypothetical protein LOD99_13370 [Oopsacas minuta]
MPERRLWYAGKRNIIPFAVPMIWRESMCLLSDCYFCMTKIDGITKKNKSTIAYPDVPSAIRPVPHSEDLSVPVPLEILDICSDNDSSGDTIIVAAICLSVCLSVRLSVAKEAEMECGIRICKNVCIYISMVLIRKIYKFHKFD